MACHQPENMLHCFSDQLESSGEERALSTVDASDKVKGVRLCSPGMLDRSSGCGWMTSGDEVRVGT